MIRIYMLRMRQHAEAARLFRQKLWKELNTTNSDLCSDQDLQRDLQVVDVAMRDAQAAMTRIEEKFGKDLTRRSEAV